MSVATTMRLPANMVMNGPSLARILLKQRRQVLLAGGSSSSGIHTNSTTASSVRSNDEQKQNNRNFTTINQDTPYTLCFLRHGQSTWNRDNRFIGWTDTPLTDDGVLEARVAGQMLARSGIMFDEVHTSLLRRSIRTTNLVLMEMGQEYIPVHKHWRLNERSYGDLVGKNKKEAVIKHGKDQVKRWRRSYDEPPPPMSDDHPFHPRRDPRYRHLLGEIPMCESLKDTVGRSSVYWDEVLAPSLKEGKTLLVVGHENNLRSILMQLEDIPKEDIINLCLPRAVPLAYRLDENLKPLDRPDGKRDEATGFLRGEWLGGDEAVAEILEHDRKQVYDTSITDNLELVGKSRDALSSMVNFVLGKPSPSMKAMGDSSPTGIITSRIQASLNKSLETKGMNGDNSFVNSDPVPAHDRDPLEDCKDRVTARA